MAIGAKLLVWLFLAASGVIVVRGDFDAVVLHTNDVHAHVEQANKYSANCSESDVIEEKCYGGVARRYTVIQKIRSEYNNVILLDAGDEFQGTVWFPFYNGLEASHFMNRLGYDAMCTGNHEFDNGPGGLLSPFLRNVSFPVLASNLDMSSYPELRQHIQPFTVLEVSAEKIGIIGYVTKETAKLVDPRKIDLLSFTDIEPSIRHSVKSLQDQGVNKIIALGHSGYPSGQVVASIPGVDIVLEGHSNTFLYNGDPPSIEEATGPYPTVVTQADGTKCLVFSAFAYGKYLGIAQVTFDDDGKVKNWSGNPILLDKTYKQDPDILAEVEIWREPLIKHTQVEIGESYVLLEGGKACRVIECNMGNLFTDAILYTLVRPADEPAWTDAGIVLWNSGGIRVTIGKGSITTGNLLEIHPFRNLVDIVWISGATLRNVLEHSVTKINPDDPPGRFLQMSGIKVVYNLTKPEGSRVLDVMVMCVSCVIPKYEPLDNAKTYGVMTNDFMISGGDGYTMLRDNIIEREPIGTLATDTLQYYINRTSPVYPAVEGRISYTLGSSDIDCDRTPVSSSVPLRIQYMILTITCVLTFMF